MFKRFPLLLVTAVLGMSGCATRPPASDTEATADFNQTNDPYEPANRFSYRVSDAIDRNAIKPVAEGYVAVVPGPVRGGVHNVLANLSSPVLFADDVSQANPRRAGDTFMRFIINSTAGGLGVFDVATDWGYPAHTTSFAVTLALWGVPSGPYLFLPLIGPSSPRDATGYGIDNALDPFSYVPHGYGLKTFNWARFAVALVDLRSRHLGDLDTVKKTALDPYATFRSLYRQNLESQIEASRHDKAETPPAWFVQ